ncbi:lectin-like protein [Pseudanabaena sp. FACHB-2040]|uniref:lectin-like protein n=1 Tax=Pseudanabaena sp. FACHB-2040 TaxID=2692859 RepID=UPI001682A145|nr:lectin-like protein [Pseudanabaena sp. FACHB-2040]MBD2260368.1 hypothetical protein [Pseudanabaena sp. FACHB-2040]
MTTLINQLTSAISLEEGTATNIAPSLDLADGIGDLTGATVKIASASGSAQGNLSIKEQGSQTQGNVPGTLIQWSYDDSQKVLTLTGNASEADYEAALRQVVYINTSGTGSKSVEISISKAGLDPLSGAYYEYVVGSGLTWADARNAAAARNFVGTSGYLATITSQNEQNFVQGLIQGNAWIGASDVDAEGQWRWVTGPESGTLFWQGNQSGSVTASGFSNWFITEPNNAAPDPGDDFALMAGPGIPILLGQWYDEPNSGGGGPYAQAGYLVDYGAGFISTGTLTLTIAPDTPPVTPPDLPPVTPPATLLPVIRDEIFNFEQFAKFGGFTNLAIPPFPSATGGLLNTQFFNEERYLLTHLDVAIAVQNGQFTNGFDHFTQFGRQEGRDFLSVSAQGSLEVSLFFDEVRYLRNNQDIASAVQTGQFANGFDHFRQVGWLEGRDFTSVFNERFYLETNQDVALAVASSAFKSGFQHFAMHGHRELRNPSQLFNQQDYLTRYSDVQAAVAAGTFSSAFEHWSEVGVNESRSPQLMLFQESFYLAQYTDVRNAVQAGLFGSGYEHYVTLGAKEGRNPSAVFDESGYLALNPDVGALVQAGGLVSGLSHYVLFGRSEGRAIAAVAA